MTNKEQKAFDRDIGKLADLTSEALDDLENEAIPLSKSLKESARIARLRNDYENLYWILFELSTTGQRLARKEAALEVAPHFTKDEFALLHKKTLDRYLEERTPYPGQGSNSDEHVLIFSVPEIELLLAEGDGVLLESAEHKYSSYDPQITDVRIMQHQTRIILSRIAQRVHDFLSKTEREILTGQIKSNIFESNHEYVLEQLDSISPDLKEMLERAERLSFEDNFESRSHALTSSRRVLKGIADYLYPPTKNEVTCHDGKKRILGDSKYINRLIQYIYDRNRHKDSKKLMKEEILSLSNRLDKLNDLASKGIHAKVDQFEVSQCVMQLFVIISELMKLNEAPFDIDVINIDLRS